MVRHANKACGNTRIKVGRLGKSSSIPTQPREAAKCNNDTHSSRQGFGRIENEVEFARCSGRYIRERKESSKMANEKAVIKQGKGSTTSSKESRGERRSW